MSRFQRLVGRLLLIFFVYALWVLSKFFLAHPEAIHDFSHDGRTKIFGLALSLFATTVLGWQVARDLRNRHRQKLPSDSQVGAQAYGFRDQLRAAWKNHPVMAIAITTSSIVLIALFVFIGG